MSDQSTPLIIIPAAGFGRRVGSPESKEMFLREENKKLIDGPLDIALEHGWPCHVLTRAEKESLIRYLQERAKIQKISIQLIEPTRDWPETVLLSEPYWKKWNILFLPDVAFTPVDIFNQIRKILKSDEADLVVVQHKVYEKLESWGYILPNSSGVELAEKPLKPKMGLAWGLYAFRNSVGQELLKAQLESTLDHQWKEVKCRADFLMFDSFKDLTR